MSAQALHLFRRLCAAANRKADEDYARILAGDAPKQRPDADCSNPQCRGCWRCMT
jgi:hypothetical protein